MPVDKFGRMSDTKTKDTGVSLTYINNNYVRSDGETPLTGSLDMRGNTIYNVADPVNSQDVVTKEYVDNTKGVKWLKKNKEGNYVVKKNVDIDGKRLMNLPPPTDDQDAVSKEYIDEIIRGKNKQLITASASYHGDLIKGNYQFTWSGQSVKSYKKHNVFNGFLIPHSGYIKRFVLEDFGLKINPSINTIFKNIPIPLFTLVVIKNNKKNEIVDLGTLNIIFDNNIRFDNVNPMIGYTYNFFSNVGDLEKHPFSIKDVLNIRTEFESERVKPYNIEKRGYEIKDNENEYFTYLATVLIELGPL